MSKIISMRSRITSHPKLDLGKPGWSFDWTFYLGVTLTVVLPQIIFGSYFGPLALLILVTGTMLGVSAGFHNFRHPRSLPPSIVPPNVLQSRTSEEVRVKLAA